MSYIPRPPLIRPEDRDSERADHAINRWLQEMWKGAHRLNFLDQDGGITDGFKPQNFDAIWVVYVSNATPDTEDTVAHNLGRSPVDMWVGVPDVNATVYRGTTAWTSTNIYLRSSAATTTVNVLVF